jgi:hypothetical protein
MEYYVDQDGQWGWANDLITFDRDSFNTMQWERLQELDGSDRYAYASAVLGGDHQEISELEESYGYDLMSVEYFEL